MGCLNSIFQVWSDKGFVQGEKNTGGKGPKGSFHVKQHPTGLIGSTDYIIFNTEPNVLDDSQVWVLGGLEDGRV